MVALLAVFTFLLGCVGFARTLPFADSGGEYSLWDICYSSLRLFILEGPEATAGWPLYLQLARILAPLIIIYTAAKAVWNYARQEVSLYLLLLRKRRFVVVCGIGETGYRIARDYCLHTDDRVVVIDQDPLNPMAAALRNEGAMVVFGNAMDPLILRKCRLGFARELFLCTSDDEINIAIAKNAERLTRGFSDGEIRRLDLMGKGREQSTNGTSSHSGLRCFLCVDDPDIYEVFAAHSFFETNTRAFALRLFNRRETIARNIFRLCPPDAYYLPVDATSRRMHVLVIGFEALGRELILQTALGAHYADFRLPRVTVLCGLDQQERVGRFLHRYPQLEKTLSVEFLYHDPLTITEEQWLQMQSEAAFSVCYVAMKSDVEAILSARRLNRLRRNARLKPLNFVVCLNQQNYLAEIIDDDFAEITQDKTQLPDYEPIEYFETLDHTISIDIVVNDALDDMARTLHRAYLESQPDGQLANPSLVDWQALPAHKKKANQRAAAHIDVKLRVCGCIVRPVDYDEPEVPFPPDAESLERLAELEHRRWMAEKHLAGYLFGDSRDEDRMWHPDLVPWDRLSDEDREKDRNIVREIPGLLALQGEKICAAPKDFGAQADLLQDTVL